MTEKNRQKRKPGEAGWLTDKIATLVSKFKSTQSAGNSAQTKTITKSSIPAVSPAGSETKSQPAETEFDYLLKSNIDFSNNIRPSVDFIIAMSSDSGVKIPIYPLKYWDVYMMYRHSDVLRIAIHALTRELFKNGFKISQLFQSQCSNPDCGRTYAHEVEYCDVCGANVRAPSFEEYKLLTEFLSSAVNTNQQTLIDLMIELERDIDLWDNAFLLIIYEYEFDKSTGEIISKKVKELIRMSPAYTGKIADRTGRLGYTDNGELQYFCPLHRSAVYTDRTRCPTCGLKMFIAGYKGNLAIQGATIVLEAKEIHYSPDEVLHVIRYSPSLMYGVSPLFSIWSKIISLIYQDRYIQGYYQRQRPPKGLLFIPTKNVEGIRKAWAYMMDRLKYNPYEISPIAYEGADKGSNVQWIPFNINLSEMEFIETRHEARRMILATYGVSPLFTGDITTSASGITNEGLQVAVTTRAVESGQRTYNDIVFPFILRALGIKDYKLELEKPEKRDELRDLEIERIKVEIAMAMKNMGFEVSLEDTIEWEGRGLKFKFSRTAKSNLVGAEGAENAEDNQSEEMQMEADKNPARELTTPLTHMGVPEMRVRRRKPEKIKPQMVSGEPWHNHPSERGSMLQGGADYFRRGVIKSDNNNTTSEMIGEVDLSAINLNLDTNDNYYDEPTAPISLLSKAIIKGYNITGRIMKGKQIDKSILSELITYALTNLYEHVFAGLTGAESNKLKSELVRGLKTRKSVSELIKDIAETSPEIVDKIGKDRIENIVRTELIALENKSKEKAYLDDEKELGIKGSYYWSTAEDERVCEACKELQAKTENGGVELETLKSLITEVSKKYYPALKYRRDYIVHPQDRCTYLQVT